MLSISDYKSLTKYTLWSFIILIVIAPSTIFILRFFGYNQGVYGKVYLAILVIFAVFFLIGMRNYHTKEEVKFEEERLVSKQYGTIHLNEIATYRIKEFRGTFSLIIKLYDGRKFSIGPQNNLARKAIEEHFKFLDDFIEKINSNGS